MAHLLGELSAANQGLARHTAIVQAVAAHFMCLDQGHFCLHGGGDIGADQASGTGTDNDEVAIESLRFLPACIDFTALQPAGDGFGNKRKDGE